MHQLIRATVLLSILMLPMLATAQATATATPTNMAAIASPASLSDSASISEYRLPPDKLAKATALYKTRVAIFVIGSFYGIAVLLLVLALRVSARLRTFAENLSSRRFLQVLIFAPLLFITIDALSLPLSIYSQQLQLSYGLSVQSWGSWCLDWIKSELLQAIIGVLLLWGLYTLVRRSPKRWWFYAWLAAIPIILLMTFAEPLLIDPLFNKFEPLESTQPQLLQQLERVMQRGGLHIPRDAMFEMKASDKVTTYNAYVTGIGASKRVVVWDNTAKDLSIPETMFVFGHEQGHYVLNHIWKLLAASIGGALIALYILYRVIGFVLARWGNRWAIRSLDDWASLPALLLVFSVLSLLTQPLVNAASRYFEHQADVYGLEVIHGLVPNSSQVAAHAFQKLGEKGLSYPYPNPLYVLWAYNHPPLDKRVSFAAEYQPWNHGKATQFVK